MILCNFLKFVIASSANKSPSKSLSTVKLKWAGLIFLNELFNLDFPPGYTQHTTLLRKREEKRERGSTVQYWESISKWTYIVFLCILSSQGTDDRLLRRRHRHCPRFLPNQLVQNHKLALKVQNNCWTKTLPPLQYQLIYIYCTV